MDENSLGPVEAQFQRARLHIRGGKRRLRQGKISAGIVTLYDALLAAMDWYIASPAHQGSLLLRDEDDLNNAQSAYAVLVRCGVLDETFDMAAFDALADRALDEELDGFDHRELLSGIENVMTRLGVMPFDEAALPPEDPNTF